jgi:outer membrane protein W
VNRSVSVKLASLVGLLAPAIAYADGPNDDAATVSADVDTVHDAPPAGVVAPPEKKRFYIRVGGVFIKPLSTSAPMELSDIDGPASLALMNGPIVGSGASVASAATPGLVVGYRLPYMHRRLSIETVLGLPFTVKFTATGTLATQSLAPTALGIPTGVQPLGPELGEAKAAPPVVTAVYSLIDHGIVQPYVGLGVAVLFSYDAKVTNPTLTADGSPQMSIPPAPGFVVQGGADFKVYKEWYVRVDVKYVAFMHADATVHDIAVATPNIPLFGDVEVGTTKMDVAVNPLIIQAGIGTDF